jgi:hypothetical protein
VWWQFVNLNIYCLQERTIVILLVKNMSKSYLLELVENACMQNSFAPCLKKDSFAPIFSSSSVLLFWMIMQEPVLTPYSFHIGNSNRFGQWHGLQSITLTSYFYKNIYWKVIYVYFYESTFQNKSIRMVFTISNYNNLKVIRNLYSQCLTPRLV